MLHPRKLLPLFFVFGLIFSLFIPSFSGAAQGNHQLDLQAVDSFLQAQVKANRLPGLAVAIVQGDEIIFAKGYGEAAPGVPVTPQTQFYIGSVTKGFTALAVMQLVEQGKLELDAPVQKYLPWFKVADPEVSRKITIRHLLNHTSGLGERGDPHVDAYTISIDEEVRLLADVRPTAPVGSQYQYYNPNYRVLGLLIEQASGESYSDYMDKHVFKPLGMLATTTDPAEASNLAQGYCRAFGFALPRSQASVRIPGAVSSGGIITSAEDMARYLLAQLHNRQADGEQMLEPKSLVALRTPPEEIGSDYGMGWIAMENGNTLAFGGATEYFQSFVAIGLKEEIGVVTLYNQDSLENMLFENNAIRDGLLTFLNGETPQRTSYGWIGWALLTLATLDLANHLRLFWMSARWVQKTSSQNRIWLWIKVSVGILIPVAVIFGLPWLVHTTEGGAPNWVEPFEILPDVAAWLLLGLSLNLIRSLIHALALLRQK
ncbi:MAG TPA: serine hydrolase domain-containing protein [Anaerolineales bacterium]|nr:serine hydrolase domain-containing protein [Anaerolineales bacterium]